MEKVNTVLKGGGGPLAPGREASSCLRKNLVQIGQVLGLQETGASIPEAVAPAAPLPPDLTPFRPLLEAWPLAIRALPVDGSGLCLVTAMLDAPAGSVTATPENSWRANALKSLEALVSGGQGESRLGALQSCLGEMAERLSLVSRGRTDPLVHVHDQGLAEIAAGTLLRFSPQQEQALVRTYPVLARHWTGTAIDWNALSPRRLAAVPLDGGGAVQLPSLGQLIGEGTWSGLTGLPLASSVGTAVWADREGARRRALAEAGERDAVGLWWYNRLGITPLAMGVVQEVLPEICASWIADRQRVTRFFLLPSELAQHVVMALSWTGDGRMGVGGFAAAADPAAAIRSAFAELVQGERMLDLRLSGLSGQMPGASRLPPALDLALNRDIRTEFRLVPDSAVAATSLPPAFTPDALATSLLDRRMRVYILDLTRPDIGLACAKVVSPDLIDWQPRFGGWRLNGPDQAEGGQQGIEREKDFSSRPFPF